MKKSNKYSLEVKERAVRLVQEMHKNYPSQWVAVKLIALKIGCAAVTPRHRSYQSPPLRDTANLLLGL